MAWALLILLSGDGFGGLHHGQVEGHNIWGPDDGHTMAAQGQRVSHRTHAHCPLRPRRFAPKNKLLPAVFGSIHQNFKVSEITRRSEVRLAWQSYGYSVLASTLYGIFGEVAGCGKVVPV